MTAESTPCQLTVNACSPPCTSVKSGSGGGGGVRSIWIARVANCTGVPLAFERTQSVWGNDSIGSVQVGLGVKLEITPASLMLPPPPVYVLSTRALVGIVSRPALI